MANIKIDLNSFKANGIYTLEFDASEYITINTQTIRLVVGFSRKGPFNSPVYLPDKKTAKRIFGDIDPFLERRGCFFHRALYTCLDGGGAIFGLNLMALNDDNDFGDKVPYYSYSVASTEANGRKVYKLYSSFYNKERFWYPDQEYFIGNVNFAGSINSGKLFNVVNLGQTPVSVLTRKTSPVGFDITAREWYGVGNVPTYIDEWDFISDYFVEMIVFQGNWSNYKNLAIDPIFSEYFDVRGLKSDKIFEFAGANEVVVLGQFTGCVIPEFVDGSNVNHSIDVIVNNSLAATGVFVAIDKERLENYDPRANVDDFDQISAVDLIGHNFADPNRTNPDIIDFLSYKTSIKEKLQFTVLDNFTPEIFNANSGDFFSTESVHLGRSYGYLNNVIVVPKPLQDGIMTELIYSQIKNLIIPGQSIIRTKNGNWAKIEQVYEEENASNGRLYMKIVYSHPSKAAEKNMIGYRFLAQDFQDDMAIIIRSSDVPDHLISIWEDPANYPAAKTDILVEDKTNRTWFYLKAKASAEFGYDINNAKVTVKIPVYNSDAMNEIALASNNYKVYFMPVDESNAIVPTERVQALDTLSIVFKPDAMKFVPGTVGIQGSPIAPNYFVAYKYSKLYEYYESGALLPGDKYYYQSTDPYFHYLEYTATVDSDGIPCLIVKGYDSFVEGKFAYINTLGPNSGANIGVGSVGLPYGSNYTRGGAKSDVSVEGIYIYGIADNLYDTVNVISWNTAKTIFSIKDEYGKQIQVGHYIVSEVKYPDGSPSQYKLTKVTKARRVYNAQLDSWSWEYTVNQPIQVIQDGGLYYVTRYYPIDDFIKYYQLVHLEGFKITDYHLPGGLRKSAQLWKILGMLDSANSNITDMLSSRDIITFRYVVDSFDGSIEPGTGPKQYLTRLAKQRQKCLAIMNYPSMKDFARSNDPRFTEEPSRVDPKPVLNTRYIADGGNLSLGPSFTFSLPDEDNGSKFAGYYAPYLVLRENGKNILVPPAAHVSNNFVKKFINGQPYAIVAGTRRGIISDPKLVGLEYEFLQKDREYLEPTGMNAIIKQKNIGYVIFGNQMAYQKTRSAFNNVHVRDLLITIEEGVEDILARYLFEFNDPSTRLEIKTIVESFLSGIRSNRGIYDYFVRMDEENNPPEVIDANTGIIDVIVEPARGLQKFIHRVTVTKTGGIASGSFNTFSV